MHVSNAEVLTLVIGTVLPLVSGLVSKANGPKWLVPVVHLGLSGVTAFLVAFVNALTTHVAFDLGSTLLTTGATFLVGVGTYFGLLKGTGAAAAVAAWSDGFIGPKAPPAA